MSTTPTKPVLSICIPLMATDDCPLRQRNWRVIANDLSDLAERRGDIEIVVAEWGGRLAEGYKHIKRIEGQGEFSRSRARNQAYFGATADLVCFCDTDMLLPGHAWDACIEQAKSCDCLSPHRQYWRANPEVAEKLTEGDRYNWSIPIRSLDPTRVPGRFVFAGGMIFCTRQAVEMIGGWDEAFQGWGKEDNAFEKMARACHLRLGHNNVARPVHLYHEPNTAARKQSDVIWKRRYVKNFARTYVARAKVEENRFPIKLEKIDYHLVDACNLACKFCSHYSNFTQPLNAVTLEQAEQEWTTWAKYIQPRQFLLLGGEPTLNKRLNELTELAAKIWDCSQIVIYTNGGFWEKHPGLPETLKRIKGRVFCSLHHSDPAKKLSIRAKFKATIDLGVHVHFGEITRHWQAFYQIGEDNKPKPYESDAIKAWQVCTAKYCAVLKANKLWKCPQVAYSDSLKSSAFPEFAGYEACEPEADAVISFFKRRKGPEGCCSHCPEKVVLVPGGEGVK